MEKKKKSVVLLNNNFENLEKNAERFDPFGVYLLPLGRLTPNQFFLFLMKEKENIKCEKTLCSRIARIKCKKMYVQFFLNIWKQSKKKTRVIKEIPPNSW